ncbi:serine hydrolase [Guyparkeria sp. SCN-R1]|uniref:serine hydrolase n=1 Tax=Guyparkeria sp. SCN-R1 TaxID=2341113 RepID=UPI001F032D2E|nr:serine hydrolase [Guyparkeria sp. SCN-R1]
MALTALIGLLLPTTLPAYPLDAAEETGIERLEGYRLANQGEIAGNRVPPGALLDSEQIRLRLADRPGFELPDTDAALTRRVIGLLGPEASRYSVSVLDISDPDRPRYAEHNGLTRRTPGSVGKVMLATALLQAIADRYPDDIEARQRLLRDTQVTADEFIQWDSHTVPFWDGENRRFKRRPLRVGDTANLWSYLDWAMSASSNAAASAVMKQLMLLHHFDEDYPVAPEREAELFDRPPAERRDILLEALVEPIARNGLDTEQLRQGAFFTSGGKARVSGTNSLGTTRELMRLLVKMEKGELVDEWSSRELKRLLYMTQRRIRYASSPALSDAAVFFKSGSLYKCDREANPDCGKYRGNVYNYMHSVAIVEHPAGHPEQVYLVTMTSNVLNKNSAVAHQSFATRLHRVMEARED